MFFVTSLILNIHKRFVSLLYYCWMLRCMSLNKEYYNNVNLSNHTLFWYIMLQNIIEYFNVYFRMSQNYLLQTLSAFYLFRCWANFHTSFKNSFLELWVNFLWGEILFRHILKSMYRKYNNVIYGIYVENVHCILNY